MAARCLARCLRQTNTLRPIIVPARRVTAMSSTPVRWLAEQLPAWEREGIVTADGARLLRERYAAEPRGGLPQMIVAAIGALLIGTGLIAVLAYNWDDFPRWVRLSLALGPLAASQAASWWVLQRGAAATRWQREAVALLQALAVGAAMALVSQIYNLPGQWTDLVFWWCVVAVPLAWVLESDAVAIAYLLGIATWTIAQARPFTGEGADCRIWYPLLLAGILPRWPGADLRGRPQPGSRAVLALSALAGLIAVAADSRQRLNSDHASVWLTMLTAAAVLLFPLDRRGIAEPLSRKPQVLLGGIVLVTLALVASFEDPARGLLEGVAQAMPLGWCWLLLTVVAAFAALALWQGRYAVVAVAALAVVPLLAFPFSPPQAGGWPVAIGYSLVLLAAAVALVGLEFLGRQGAARIGATLITILVILRMVDAEFSLLTKGLAFIVIGAAFLGFNVLISRCRAAIGGPPA